MPPRISPLLVRPTLVVALACCLSGAGRAAPPTAPSAPPPATGPAPADSLAFHVAFHDYELNLPSSGGWELVSRAPEDEAVTVRLVWENGAERFTLGQMEFARLGLFDPAVPRQPRPAFAALAAGEERDAMREAAGRAGITWVGSRRDTVADAGRVFRRLQYGVRAGDLDGLTRVVYWFPSSFARDGFFVRATMRMWRRPGREDLSALDDFSEALHSLNERAPQLDRRLLLGPAPGQARLSLPLAYYDARARALHSPHDTTQAPCAVQLEDTLAVVLQATQLPGVVFVSFRQRVPPPGDRSPGDRFGKAMDRDGDGRFDLVFFSQGWTTGFDHREIRTFYVVADDDGDGRVDGIVCEDGNNDRDGLADHGIFVQDRAGTGEPDRAWVFDNDIADPVRPVPHQGSVFLLGLVSRPGEEAIDFGPAFREWSRYLGWLNRAAAGCRASGAGRR